jgi:hypothetical protein
MLTRSEPLLDWDDWYRLARDVLDYAPDESVSYANVRYVESRNRELLSAGWPSDSQVPLAEISDPAHPSGVHSKDPTNAQREQE